MKNSVQRITVYTDGGSRGNGKKDALGGWGVLLQYKSRKKELCGSVLGATNNEMELLAVIKAFEEIQTNSIPVDIHTDSAYVSNGINKGWVDNWIRNGWVNSSKKPVANKELWQRLYRLIQKQDEVKIIKVKGHSDNEGNNMADMLVNKAMDDYLLKMHNQ